MAIQHNELRLCSFNSRGHSSDRLDYISELVMRSDIVLVQEHWLYDFELDRLVEHIDGVDLVGVSAMESDSLTFGRPHGGCAIIIKRRLGCSISHVPTDSRRLCACICDFKDNTRLLVINTYMPCDGSDIAMFLDELQNIAGIIEHYNDINYVIVGGDFNADLERTYSLRGSVLKSFCSNFDLHLCVTNDVARIEFTYFNEFSNAKSVVDHFLISENLSEKLFHYECLQDGNNLSDHMPLMMSLFLPRVVVSPPVGSGPRTSEQRVAWHRASPADIQRYQYNVSELLALIEIPLEAVHCPLLGCEQHSEAITAYHDCIINACIEAAQRTIPRVGKAKQKAGWSEHVGAQKADAIFWHRLWVENGRPENGMVRDIMVRTRREYKRRARWVCRNQDQLRSGRMASALIEDRNRDFWQEFKKSRRGPLKCATSVDGKEGADNICNHFRNKYSDLFNSVSYDREALECVMNDLRRRVQDRCASGSCYDDHSIEVADVTYALGKMKRNKSDNNEQLKSDHLMNAPHSLHVHLSLLLHALLRHDSCPPAMLLSVLVPIPKSMRKSLGDGNNYRSIAISSLIGKVMDHIVMRRHAHVLCTSRLQFGFKPKHSTTQCTFVLEEVVDHYLRGQSSAHLVLLDATKAFDRINFVKLFSLLNRRDLCPLTILLLASLYVHQSLIVRWDGCKSESFQGSNGVKQGGVLSPVLFCVYLDILLERLSSLGVGAHLGELFVGALGYADDLALVSPSVSAMDSMLGVCEDFANEYDVMFNSLKSQSLVLGRPLAATSPVFRIHGQAIPRVERAVHLGTFIGSGSKEANLHKAASDLAIAVNKIRRTFPRSSLAVFKQLFRTHCCSFYGCPLWDLSSIEPLSVRWRQSLRFLLGLPQRTHRWLFPLILRAPPPEDELLWRFAKFWASCSQSANPVLHACAELSVLSSTPAAHNLRLVLSELSEGDPHSDLGGRLRDLWYSYLNNSVSVQATLAAELIDLINGNLLSVLVTSEYVSLLNFVVTS